ncbi:MAG: prolipoprotein diacylglyceryl transferase [Carboxydocellales bacterium]
MSNKPGVIMHPILAQIGPITLRWWGIMVALGILAGIWVAYREAIRVGLDGEKVLDFAFWAVLSGFLGARLWELIFTYENFADQPWRALMFWEGGLSIQGAVLGGLVAAIWFIRKYKLNFWQWADILAPGVILGQAIGRVGCLLNGDAFGIPINSWLGVRYAPGTPAYSAFGDTPLFPAEIMEGAWDLAIFSLLLVYRKKKPFEGSLALGYFFLYSLGRFTLEFWRADSLTTIMNLKAAQITSAIVALVALVIFLVKKASPRQKQC